MIHTRRPPQSWPAMTARSQPERVEDADEAGVDPVAVVDHVGFVAAAVAGQVGRNHVEAGLAERGDLVPPRVRQLGKAVQQQHDRPVAGTGFQAEQTNAIGRHVPATHCSTLTGSGSTVSYVRPVSGEIAWRKRLGSRTT